MSEQTWRAPTVDELLRASRINNPRPTHREPVERINHHSTFGVEFESNGVTRDDQVITSLNRSSTWLRPHWNAQGDPTTAIEINTPIFKSMLGASTEISRQFTTWIGHYNVAFYAYNANSHVDESLTSSGQHIHIGTDPSRDHCLTCSEKESLVLHARDVYPLLMAISAQPTPSNRMLTSGYCRTIGDNEDGLPDGDDDHQQEINYSHLGTVEFRVFDTNIPQCSLAEAWVLTKICDHIRRDKSKHLDVNDNFKCREYNHLRFLACNHGYTDLPIPEMLGQIKEMIKLENPNNFVLDSVRDIYYMMAKYSLSPSDIYHIIKPSRFRYFSTMFMNPNKYLENLVAITDDAAFKSVFARMLQESSQIRSFDEFIALSTERIQPLFNVQASKPVEVSYVAEVKEAMAKGDYFITRLADMADVDSSAREVTKMLNHSSQSRVLISDNLLKADERYYLLCVNVARKADVDAHAVILGAIGWRLANGELKNLVVKDEYQHLGVGGALLRCVVDTAVEGNFPSLFATIKRDNELGVKMLEKLGFEKEMNLEINPPHAGDALYRRNIQSEVMS